MTVQNQPDPLVKEVKLGPSSPRAAGEKTEKKEPTVEELVAAMENESLKADVREAARMQLKLRMATMRRQIQEIEGGATAVTTRSGDGEKGKRWSVIGGKPVEDEDGPYETFAQAYKVASLEVQAAANATADKNSPGALFNLLQSMGLLGGKTDSFTESLAKRYLDNIDAQLKAAVESKSKTPAEVQVLTSEVESLRSELKQVSDPVALMTRAKAITDSMKAAGFIPEPAPGADSIEARKVQYEHDEKMEQIKSEARYKEKLGDTISSIPERVGRGLGSQIMETEETQKTGKTEEAAPPATFKCVKCGTMIPVSVDAPQIECPNPECRAIYTRKG